MPAYFLDTSACVKHFHREVGSEQVEAMFTDANSQRIISQLGAVEIVSALATKVRAGELDDYGLAISQKQLFNEVAQRQLLVARVLTRHFRAAESLLLKHAVTIRLRTADAIQLAVAIDVANTRGVDFFVCADRVLSDVAADEGLVCLTPL